MDFFQFFDKINGKPYEDGTPAPAKYNFLDYAKQVTSNHISNTEEGGGVDLFKPITDDDLKTTSSEDMNQWMRKHGTNTTRMGDPLDDEGLKKYTGQTW